MFDLNEQINKWRTNLAESEKFSKADIDELEAHLREEIEDLTPAGLSQQEAFVIAKGRLGDTASLENEFAKVNGGHIVRKRLFWLFGGMLVYILAGHLSSAASSLAYLLGSLAGVRGNNLGILGESLKIITFCMAIVIFCLACRKSDRLRLSRFFHTRKGKIALCMACVGVFAVRYAVQIADGIVRARLFGVEQFGEWEIFSRLVRLGFSIFLLMALAMLLIRLRMSVTRLARR